MSYCYPDDYRPARRRQPPVVILGLLIVALLFAVLVVPLMAWIMWPNAGGSSVSVAPRAITPRGTLAEDEASTIALYENAAPSVVHITTKAVKRNPYSLDPREVQQGSGSGFVWDNEGHIVTNYHVIQGASSAQVTLADPKGRMTYQAKLVGTQPDKDLAVLLIDAPKDRLHPIPIGTSSDLKVGQKVYAIGNPFGLDQTLTTGIISALNRQIESVVRTPINGVIQTDAAINPGNSGGPLLDSSGRLIGVNTAIYSPSGASAGIGFAIPVDEVNEAVPRVIARASGKTPSVETAKGAPRLGIVAVEDQLARLNGIEGIVIREVQPDGPAAKAGLRGLRYDPSSDRYELGDVIIAIDDKPTRVVDDMRVILRKRKFGDTINVTVRRDEEPVTLRVTLIPF
jgi:S1-C subfamily serine protease